MNTPHFLTALGLGADADERAIRRAYAQRLKVIDQEAEPGAFQSLHEAFEAAARWVRDTSRQAPPAQDLDNLNEAGGDDGAASPAPGTDELTPLQPLSQPQPLPPALRNYVTHHGARTQSPRPLVPRSQLGAAGTVFEEFSASLERLATAGGVDATTVDQLLGHALNDPRLLSLSAGLAFEFHVAELLANGWRTGHDHLFQAASERFHWDEDRRALDSLGKPGADIERALVERSEFLKAGDSALALRERLIERLRDTRAPSEQEVAAYHKTVVKLFTRYPNWMRLMTDLNNILVWRDGALNLAEEVEGKRQLLRYRRSNPLVSAAAVLIIVIAFFAAFGGLIKLITPK